MVKRAEGRAGKKSGPSCLRRAGGRGEEEGMQIRPEAGWPHAFAGGVQHVVEADVDGLLPPAVACSVPGAVIPSAGMPLRIHPRSLTPCYAPLRGWENPFG